eukprot:TRINITY_DN7091_c0_g1_i1.p1 TRINITY_DN7091_c0_g1~~TRINITY_DN7091_c0_g1_i1.p1  ORF type:complete len:105 (+),score=4.22 TRINITY_DN7091_c0_g1_i1:121-435(+)
MSLPSQKVSQAARPKKHCLERWSKQYPSKEVPTPAPATGMIRDGTISKFNCTINLSCFKLKSHKYLHNELREQAWQVRCTAQLHIRSVNTKVLSFFLVQKAGKQ